MIKTTKICSGKNARKYLLLAVKNKETHKTMRYTTSIMDRYSKNGWMGDTDDPGSDMSC